MSRKRTLESDFIAALQLGYDPSDPSAFAVKANWKRVSKSYFQSLVHGLNLRTANTWYNSGGTACSGDINLQVMGDTKGFHLFGNLDGMNFFIIRPIAYLGDYTGGTNRQLYIEDMRLKPLLAILRTYLDR